MTHEIRIKTIRGVLHLRTHRPHGFVAWDEPKALKIEKSLQTSAMSRRRLASIIKVVPFLSFVFVLFRLGESRSASELNFTHL